MSDQLDNELRKHISKVFENYEDTEPAAEGWTLLRQKFPEKRRPKFAPIWWSVAAVLLVLCLFGAWFLTQPARVDQQVVLKPKAVRPQNMQQPGYSRQQNTLPQQLPGDMPRNTPDISQTPPDDINGGEHSTQSRPDRSMAANGVPPVAAPVNALAAILPGVADNTGVAKPANTLNTGLTQQPGISPADSAYTVTQAAVLAQQRQDTRPEPNTVVLNHPADSASTIKQSKMSVFLAGEQKKEEAQNTRAQRKPNAEKKVLYSVYAATYFNYAKGSNSQINNGAGFSTDIKLFSNFRLLTGVAIAKNTLSYNNEPVKSGLLSDALTASVAKVEVIPAFANNKLGITPMKVYASPTVAGYNVSLTGLDVPINIKYEFNPQANDSYISAGLSSGTFFNETYNYRYDNTSNSTAYSAPVPDATTTKSFTRFDFARTLNLSVGMGYQITKHNRLVIEPFVKYPLSGLGSQQIKFGAGGINLRLKFQTAKK